MIIRIIIIIAIICRMFPKYDFDDSLAQIERLGKKRELQVHMQRYRLDQLTRDDDQPIEDDDEMNQREDGEFVEPPMDEFEKLIDEQIALSRTNVGGKSMDKSFGNMSSISGIEPNKSSSQTMKSSSFFPSDSQDEPATPVANSTQINGEVRARIAENRRKAMEIREQKKREEEEAKREMEKSMKSQSNTQEISNMIFDDDDI